MVTKLSPNMRAVLEALLQPDCRLYSASHAERARFWLVTTTERRDVPATTAHALQRRNYITHDTPKDNPTWPFWKRRWAITDAGRDSLKETPQP